MSYETGWDSFEWAEDQDDEGSFTARADGKTTGHYPCDYESIGRPPLQSDTSKYSDHAVIIDFQDDICVATAGPHSMVHHSISRTISMLSNVRCACSARLTSTVSHRSEQDDAVQEGPDEHRRRRDPVGRRPNRRLDHEGVYLLAPLFSSLLRHLPK